MFLISLLSCTSSLNIDITKHTNDDDSEVTSSTPCTITIYKQSEIESPYIDVTITSAEKIIIQLELYGGKELLQREVLLPTTGSHTVEMFWPKQTQNHTWQEQYGTNATLTAIGFSGNEETCRETLEEEFSSIDDRIQSSRFITSPNWNVESAQANGLHVSVPALHESDKFALISTPLSQTLLSVIGPFSREDIFRDLTNLSVFEDSKGNLLSLITQESWPGFEEQHFLIHNAITTEQQSQWTLESSIHHTISVTEVLDNSLDVLTSSWDERFGFSPGYYSHPIRIQLSEDSAISTALTQDEEIYPESFSSPITYNNFVWKAAPKSNQLVSIIFANNALTLPPSEENTSSVLLLDENTGEEIWYANQNNIDVIHTQNDLVVALSPIPDQELALTFPHAAQFDGERLYIQDHMDVESGSQNARINAFTKDGSYLWSYAVPDSFETTNNARRRHGGMWSLTTDEKNAVCAFFVDTQTVHCVDQDGTEVGWMEKHELSENQADKWHTLDYLENWKNTINP